ncbi:MarR family winged helix-turn-helix transcriptional regulator [Myceligenerans indicum]|uniref:MarR family transcriptional regulator n=1 Tax=Myceligenerans indicum TaxID=2593663 RepID=A0ABS1LG08_9MICO|nr:MarR family transcriptional regulator [Myceligenerans indicum]MBL0885157.1 MarR family transcriptional regulator [Myceligenerans indicum]
MRDRTTDTPSTLERLDLLALGTRLKRLGERLQADTTEFLRASGVHIAAGSLPVMVSISERPGATVSDIVDDLGIAQPGVTRTLGTLADAGLVAFTRDPADARRRTIALTDAGEQLLTRAQHVAWQPVAEALRRMVGTEDRALVTHLAHLEAALDERSLHVRAVEARRQEAPR